MKRNGMSKLSASLFVLVMVMSTLGALPMVGQAQTPTYKNIYIPVGSGGVAVIDAWVNLTNVHTGETIAASYLSSNSSYVVTNAPSGYYRVDVAHPNYYDQYGAKEIVFDGFSDYTVNPPISLTGFPGKVHTWNVTVTDSDLLPLMSAKVGFYDNTAKEFVATGMTDSSGNVVFKMFGTSVNYYLVVMKSTYATYTEPITVTSNGWRNVTLAKPHTVSGYAVDSHGPASAVSYLINQDPTTLGAIRVLKSSGSFVTFDAYDGTFTLVVDAPGAAAYVSTVTVAGADVLLTIPTLTAQTQRTEWVNLTFGVDFNDFALSVATQWSYDDAYPGLKYGDMGSLRAQVDLVMGNGDGTLDGTEAGLFLNKVQSYGSQYVSSFQLLNVNATVYSSATSVTGLVEDLGASLVTSPAAVNYGYTCQFTSHIAIDVGASEYTANAAVRYDSISVDYKYAIDLVNNYQLVQNSSTSRVVVTGSDVVMIDPTLVPTGGSETVSMTLEEWARPVAIAGVETTATDYAYAVKEDGVNVSRYLVAVNQNVTFTSGGSSDPNDPSLDSLTYTWNFGDSSPVIVTKDESVVHMYTAAANLTVNLTVTDPVGMMNWSDIVVTVDALQPTPVISVKEKVVNITDNSILVDMREAIFMNGTWMSTDDAVVAGDRAGVIDHVQFEWGDGNISDRIYADEDVQNASHSYERAGTYTVVLNVTDVVGNYKNTSMLVKVNDTDAPVVSLVVRNATYGTTLVENNTLILDANGTHDNVDALGTLRFSWNFGDGQWYNATGYNATLQLDAWNVTHIYAKTGQITLKLNVTDLSGNSKIESRLITLNSGPRPKMNIDAITYDPVSSFTEGSAGTIIVNMTNTGSANATNIVVQFYIVRADGTQKLIGTSSDVTLNGTDVTLVEVGQTVQVKFRYTPDAKGSYTIRVNVTSTDQLRPASKNAPTLTVEQAAWKTYALWGGVAAVIILVPLLLYLRGRWAKREKKGPRREKKEKASSEEEL